MADTARPSRAHTVLGALLALALAASAAWTAWAYYRSGPAAAGPRQPIPFSHKLHVADKGIDCRFCHTGVDRSAQAGLPEVEKCLYCHASVITEHPWIRTLQGYFDRGAPIPWVRVYWLPDHARFTHRVHLSQGVECTECHGPVEEMDRLKPPNEFLMGFCMDCHNRRAGPRDCVVCHH